MNYQITKVSSFFLLILLINVFKIDAQVIVKSCEIQLNIPHFEETSLIEKNAQTDIIQKILGPIEKTGSNLEIRFWSTQYGNIDILIDLKCDGSHLVICKYSCYISAKGRQNIDESKYRNIGPPNASANYNIMLSKEPVKQLNSNQVKELFKKLTDNHLFDLPTEAELVKIVSASYPQFKATGEANIYMQVNVNGKIREMKYSAFYSENADRVYHYRNLMNLYKIFDFK